MWDTMPIEFITTAACLILLYGFIKLVLKPKPEPRDSNESRFSACDSPECVRCERYNELRHNAHKKLSSLSSSKRFELKRLLNALEQKPSEKDKAQTSDTFNGDSSENINESTDDQQPNVLFIKELHASPFWDPDMAWMSTFYIRERFDSIWRDLFEIERQFDDILNEYWTLVESIDQDVESMDKNTGWTKNSSESGHWYTYYIYNQGHKVAPNADMAPVLTQLIDRRLGSSMTHCVFGNTFISVMAPGTRIEPHYGPCNVRLRCHLGLNCPPGWNLTVNGISREWERGRCLVFDDSFLHSVAHQPDREPIIQPNKEPGNVSCDIQQPEYQPDKAACDTNQPNKESITNTDSSIKTSEEQTESHSRPNNDTNNQPISNNESSILNTKDQPESHNKPGIDTNTQPISDNPNSFIDNSNKVNDISTYRAVLIIDLWHPEVSIIERGAIMKVFS